MFDTILEFQRKHLEFQDPKTQKELGQFFTDGNIARYMASLISLAPQPKIRLLDAGAGLGILTVSAVLRLKEIGFKEIHSVLYEIDSRIIPSLKKIMSSLAKNCEDKIKFTYEIVHKDFVVSRPDKLPDLEKFDLAIINPPYFKYNKASLYGKITSDLYKGDPNIYASFMAIALSCLKPQGQMISITPRSFSNGLYFKGFRYFLYPSYSIEKIHTFVSRDQVFKDSSVLQENIICRFKKKSQSENIEITISQGIADISVAKIYLYPKNLIIDQSNNEKMIRIPDGFDEAIILLMAQELDTTFEKAGYFVSTGPVVNFRAKEYITDTLEELPSVPLIQQHNISQSKVIWNGANTEDLYFKLNDGYKKHLKENKVYVLLKRVSSKEEKRRLTAAVHNPETVSGKFIGFDNKVNYLGVKDEDLSLTEACGLTAVLNSTFMDQYFRCLSGNTQVNATDIRVLPFPKRDTIRLIGENLMGKNLEQKLIDDTITSFLKIDKTNVNISTKIKLLITIQQENKLTQAKKILKALGLPEAQQNDRSGRTFLALAEIKPEENWATAQNPLLTTRDIMDFIRDEYDCAYQPNTRETIRRQTLHQFEQARLIDRNRDNPARATNSPKNNYSLNEPILEILREFPNGNWEQKVHEFKKNVSNLIEEYQKRIDMEKIPITLLDGKEIKLSPGEHNQLHADIIHEFCSRFIGKNGKLLYIGDTASSRDEGGKLMILEKKFLQDIGVPPMSHDKLPDVVVFDKDNQWLFLIEAVTSHGPISAKRWKELEDALKNCIVEKIYVTAFPDKKRFKEYVADIAWETEVWIAENPSHMIHFNGHKFLGPFKST